MLRKIFLTIFICWVGLLDAAPLHTEIKAVIFDCDGVLVDTEQLKFDAWREALKPYGVEFALQDYMPMVGHSSKAILAMIESLKGVKLPAALIGEKDTHYRRLQAQGVPPLQPAIDHARKISEQGQMKLGLASSAPRAEILVNLKQIGLDDAFDVIVSGSDDLSAYHDPSGTNKPKPYIYLEIAKRLEVDPAACIVYEDTSAGIEAAAGAGMVAIAVPNRFTVDHDFSRASAILPDGMGLGLAQLRSIMSHPASDASR